MFKKFWFYFNAVPVAFSILFFSINLLFVWDRLVLVSGYEDIYNKLVVACEEVKIEDDSNFAMAVYLIFSNLPGESI